MSNFEEYKSIVAIHPGYYVNELINDMEISQAEFAMRMGTTPKTISKLVNAQINLSPDLAQKLSAMTGTGVDVWLNLQVAYNQAKWNIDRQKSFAHQEEILDILDYSFFVKNADLPDTQDKHEQITNLQKYLMISDLTVLKNPYFLFRQKEEQTIEGCVCSRAWLQTALNIASTIDTKPFSPIRLADSEFLTQSSTYQNPREKLELFKEEFRKCGVAFVILPPMNESGIDMAVKWIYNDKVLLAANDELFDSPMSLWITVRYALTSIIDKRVKTVDLINEGMVRKDGDQDYIQRHVLSTRYGTVQ